LSLSVSIEINYQTFEKITEKFCCTYSHKKRFFKGTDFLKKLAGALTDKKTGGGLIFFFQGKGQINMAQDLDRLASSISSLGRSEVEKKIKNFRGRFELDFTDDYLKGLTVDRLRHILFAAMATKFGKAD
jgi:hypothetical protein